MQIIEFIRNLCTPAYVYLVLSALSIIAMMFQNAGNSTQFCIGEYACPVPHTSAVFISQILYVAFWTFILNSICKAGYKSFSWFLVLFPIMLMFVSIGLMILTITRSETYDLTHL